MIINAHARSLVDFGRCFEGGAHHINTKQARKEEQRVKITSNVDARCGNLRLELQLWHNLLMTLSSSQLDFQDIFNPHSQNIRQQRCHQKPLTFTNVFDTSICTTCNWPTQTYTFKHHAATTHAQAVTISQLASIYPRHSPIASAHFFQQKQMDRMFARHTAGSIRRGKAGHASTKAYCQLHFLPLQQRKQEEHNNSNLQRHVEFKRKFQQLDTAFT